mmetsp:Transcript_71022/g.169458  ORF Transcript_71022/g.169458 Transcript_71022/m.169458 type:complete len:160 (-) Transcript_71022:1077-1556(-)
MNRISDKKILQVHGPGLLKDSPAWLSLKRLERKLLVWKSLHEPSLDLLALQSLRLKPNQALHDLHHQLMCFRTVASCAARAILQFMNGRVFRRLQRVVVILWRGPKGGCDRVSTTWASLRFDSQIDLHFNLDGWSIIGRITIFLLCCERTPEADHDWAS